MEVLEYSKCFALKYCKLFILKCTTQVLCYVYFVHPIDFCGKTHCSLAGNGKG